jgi:putative transposase
VIDFMREWSEKTEIETKRFVVWIGIVQSTYYSWVKRYGRVNEHNSWVPRDFWIDESEKESITEFYSFHRDDGYRRVTYMLLDANIVAVSPSSVYRVLKEKGLLQMWNGKPTTKGTGFQGPAKAHEHWHIDMSYINIRSTFYYLISILDGYSRFIVHWELRESMTEGDVEIVLQRAGEKYPEEKPRIISDNGPQFIARDFKEFIRLSGMSHVRTSPYYPQSNGKIERWHQSLKRECIRPKTPLDLEDARRLVGEFVEHYNTARLHSAIGYITPKDKLEGREKEIFSERDRKLTEARERRKAKRKEAISGNQCSSVKAPIAPVGLGLDRHKNILYPGDEKSPYQQLSFMPENSISH